MITTFHPEFIDRHEDAIQLYKKANKRLVEGDADDTLTAARKCLEFFIKDFAGTCNLPLFDGETGKAKSIEELINMLTACCFLNAEESVVLHRLRKLGNVGSHDLGSMSEAEEAMELLEETILIFAEKEARISGVQETEFYSYDDGSLSSRARAISKSPRLYRLAAEGTMVPFLVACYLPRAISLVTTGIIPLIFSMAVVLICVMLHGHLLTRFNAIPVPPGKRNQPRFDFSSKVYHGIANFFIVLLLPILLAFLFGLSTVYSSFFAKIIIWATALLSVYISPALRMFLRIAFVKKQ